MNLKMKFAALAAWLWLEAICLAANTLALEEVSPHFSTNVQIVWKAPTNDLPQNLSIYRRLPRTFSTAAISTALALTPITSAIPLVSSTNGVYLRDRTREGDDPMAGYFRVDPEHANIGFQAKYHYSGSPADIPSDEAVATRAWEIAAQLGLDRRGLAQKEIATNMCDCDLKGRATTNNPCGHEISLARRVDGVDFYSSEEGLSIEFGSRGQIRSFSLTWPNLKQVESHPIASPEQIIRCIRTHQTPMSHPSWEDGSYLMKVKELAKARKLTVTKVTAFYGEGQYGQEPKDQGPAEFVSPFAELDVIADFGTTTTSVRLFCPILETDAERLSKPK
jgi:hypothetical protein